MDLTHPKKKRTGRPPVCEKKRFWGHVLPRASTGCWEWTSAINHNGYGVFTGSGRKYHRAHRFSWEIHNDPIPDGLVICHKCDNPKCVRPDHLFLGTNKDNANDRDKKSRSLHGARHHSAKLNEEQVLEARRLYKEGEKIAVLARKFGISEWPMSLVVRRKVWKSLP